MDGREGSLATVTLPSPPVQLSLYTHTHKFLLTDVKEFRTQDARYGPFVILDQTLLFSPSKSVFLVGVFLVLGLPGLVVALKARTSLWCLYLRVGSASESIWDRKDV